MNSYKTGTLLLICVFTFGISVSSSMADFISVPGDFETIQQAVDAADDGDIIELGIGVFKGDGNRDIRLRGKAITIRGAFGAEFSVVDAQGTSQVPYRGFIFDSGETIDTVIEGITICGGATLPGAIADPFNGGGLFFREGSATIKDCIICDNHCGCWGAGVYVSFGAHPTLINCDISGNVANDDGGAVFVWNGGSVTLINCNLNENEALVTGGAVSSFGSGGGANIINSTMVGNHAPFGSALFGHDVTVVNSIVWGNTGGQVVYQNWSTITNSIVQGGYEGVGNLDADPLFVDESGFDYRIRPGSPAIDAADNTAIPLGILIDFHGNTRFHDDLGSADTGTPGTHNAVSDMGASEFQGQTYRFRTKGFN